MTCRKVFVLIRPQNPDPTMRHLPRNLALASKIYDWLPKQESFGRREASPREICSAAEPQVCLVALNRESRNVDTLQCEFSQNASNLATNALDPPS